MQSCMRNLWSRSRRGRSFSITSYGRFVSSMEQALDPHLRHGPRKLGRACGAGHSLLGAHPLDPLVHMLNPSSGTHLYSQFWYTLLISVVVYFIHLNHQCYTYTCTYTTALALLGHALPGASPWSPQYTFLISVQVHMFNLSFATNVLFKLSNLHFSQHQWHGSHSAWPACQGQALWTFQCTCFISVLTHTLS